MLSNFFARSARDKLFTAIMSLARGAGILNPALKMRLKIPILVTYVFCAWLLLNGPENVDAFWDSFPGVSQIKSLVQLVSGDAKGAKKTQENFLNTAPGLSQAKSFVEVVSGNPEAARRTQNQFLNELVQPIAENTPVLGHAIGAVHLATGDTERGKQIMKGASVATAAVIGGILGGPAGSIAAATSVEGLITVIDSAKNNEYTPFGLIDYISHIDSASAGDHFDQLMGIGAEFVGGKSIGKTSESGFGATKRDLKRKLDDGGGVRRTPDEQTRKALKADTLQNTASRDLDLTNPTHVEIARQRTGLPLNHQRQLEPIDFRVINDIRGTRNCFDCSLAAARRRTVTELYRTELNPRNIHMLPNGAPTIEYIVNLYREAGFTDTEIVFQGAPRDFEAFLNQNLRNGDLAQFSLAYDRYNDMGHVVHARVWRTFDGRLEMLITDFQEDPFSSARFSTIPPRSATNFYIIVPQVIRRLGDVDAASRGIHEETVWAVQRSSAPNGDKCSNNKRIIGYVPNWSKRPFTIQQSITLTNAIYAFFVMSSNGALKMDEHAMSKERLIDLVLARDAHIQRGMNLKVSFAVGGWENSQHFSNVLGNAGSRSFLIDEIQRVINQYQLDGVDIDWEYPVTGGATEGVKADRDNYITFLRELRSKLGNDRLISIAAGAGQEAFTGYDVANIIKYVDWIGVMSYDFFGAWDSQWGAYVGPNAPLYHSAPPGYSGKLNCNWAIKQYACSGKRPDKIVMGVPFYGRFWYQTYSAENPKYPLYRKAVRLNNGSYGGSAAYWEILDKWQIESSAVYQKQWDELSQTPWATDGSLVLSYENQRSITSKLTFANEYGLGGIMIWSVDQDDMGYNLLNTVFKGVCYASGGAAPNAFKCNPLGTEKRWWTWLEDKDKAGMCGKNAPLYNGYYPLCDPDDPGYACCSANGYCGNGAQFCDCPSCVDYGKNPKLLVQEPVKPSRPIEWHVGFDIVKPGQPRCGVLAPKLANGKEAICNPDGNDYCCSPAGYCGSGSDYCECDGCFNHRTGKRAGQSGNQRWYTWRDGALAGRCGVTAPKIDGHVPICNPKDAAYHCCSSSGYYGSGPSFCNCAGCVNYAK